MRFPAALLLLGLACPLPAAAPLFGMPVPGMQPREESGAHDPPPDRFDHFPRLATSLWVALPVRNMTDPSADAGGVGMEFMVRPTHYSGITFMISSWWTSVEYEVDNPTSFFGTSTRSRDVHAYEFELGFRVYPWQMDRFGIYFDSRLALTIADGNAPVVRTESLGGGTYAGFEFGWRRVMLFAEGGLGMRFALGKDGVGWLESPAEAGSLSIVIDLLRTGLRVYF